MSITRYNSPGIEPRVGIKAVAKMLMFQRPVQVLSKFGAPFPVDPNSGETIVWRRPVPFTAADQPLTEGVTPTSTTFRYEDVRDVLREYGFVVELSNKIEDLHEDPVFNNIIEQVGLNLGRTVEQIIYGKVRAGTSVIYANGSARNAVNTPITLPKLRQAARFLKSQKAMKMTSVLQAGPNKIGTVPIEACWPVAVNTDLENDIRQLPGFRPTSEYSSWNLISEYEFGAVEEFRFVSSPDLAPWPDAGGAAGTSVLSTSGTNADVYPVLIFGRESYGLTPLSGQDALQLRMRRPGTEIDSNDPLGQKGWVGWRTWFSSTILNQSWMVRIECAASAL
jgi:N4-gp56 family major capsid protein